ncbi:uncharacterized protein LOC109543420 [Dendroctonus ponderosae]|uniref:uncharacterized protein LOC109543420 n=1 Tax=Dendroctonus ponderosae TaxID=77166 RepID=UPI0020364F90|nr:uncharacterized protein LOC109543420 [Dendroctonus ponderosae]XP_048526405.1 uncharacterized protein LOC109543420 [Dendroctonus ponderosae]
MHIKTLVIIAAVNTICKCCDLEELLGPKQTSLEDATLRSSLVFRGMALPIQDPAFSVFTVFFELITVYKGDGFLKEWRKLNNYFRKINVTFETRTTAADCLDGNKVPRDYVVFASLIQDEIRAGSVAKWDENADLRVWKALGWSQWSDWSSCSVSCSAGIQQRTRHCLQQKCSGFNIQQRHCNLFSCSETVTPLDQKSGKFFHPSQDRWQPLADRPTAWRLTPNSYIWIPASLLFSDEECRNIPKDFSLALTMRVPNATLGTVFSVRSRSRQHLYLSLEVTGADLKLIHAAESGTDMVRIPAGLDDGVWHQIAFSLREGRILDVFVDCEWSRTEVLLAHSLEVPDDCDIIVGYLFTGDLEQLSIIKNPYAAHLQCSNTPIPIEDPDVRFTKDGFKLFTRKHAVKSRKHRY